MTAGVYAIRNTANGRVYVGSSMNMAQRWASHICCFRRGESSKLLQRDWNTYGIDAFAFECLEETAPDGPTLIEAEQRWIEKLRTESPGGIYNRAARAWRPIDSQTVTLRAYARRALP